MTPRAFRDLFAREVARFAAHYPFVDGATLILVDREVSPYGRAWRDVAWANWRMSPLEPGGLDSARVNFLRRALALPRKNLIALIRHEIGHLFYMRRSEPGPGSEARADRIAARVGGAANPSDAHHHQADSPHPGSRRPRPAHPPP